MPLPTAAIPLAGALIGGLLGGDTIQQTDVSVNNSNSNQFNPIITFGGSTNFTPSSPTDNNFSSDGTQSATQEQADPSGILDAFNPLSLPPVTLPIPSDIGFADVGLEDIDFSTASQASFSPVLIGVIALAAGAAYFSTTRGEE